MFPWLAFGHMIPFFQLSKQLASKGNKISFVSTPNNIHRLPKIPQHLSHLLTYIPLPLPCIPNLPSNAEATSDLPIHQVPYLKKAYDELQTLLASFLQTCSPDWVIYDFAPHWLPSLISQLNIPGVCFVIFNASFLSFLGPSSVYLGGKFAGVRDNPVDYTVPCKWIPFENNLRFRMFEIMEMINSIGENASGVTDGVRFASALNGAKIVAVRSCPELESEYLDLLEKEIYEKTVIPIGLLPPSVESTTFTTSIEDQDIKAWLDKKEVKSVIYVAFGSEATLSQEQTAELALGLELSEVPFFWVFKDKCQLPHGFEERVEGRGYICRKWAPQLIILSHPSVGGFLTHSGWSSVIEALSFGCPLALLPLINDQALVARLLEWKGIGFEIDRDESDGSFSKKSVSQAVRKLVVEEQGKSYRIKATELKQVVGDVHRHERYVNEFEQCLKRHRSPTSNIN